MNPTYTTNVGVGYIFPDFSYGKEYAAVGVENRYEVNDSVTVQKGAHSIKAGFDVSYVPYIDASASNLNGTFYFNTDQPFNPANTANLTHPYEFTQGAVAQIYYLPSTQTAYFVEDSWKAKPNLTVSAGARYERQYGSPFLDTYTPNTTTNPVIPNEGNPHLRGDRNNVSPRIGVSWDPFKKGNDVIRGGYGVYYNFIQTELSEAEKLNFVACPITIVSATNNVGYPNPYGGQTTAAFCKSSPANVTILSPGLSNPYQHQFTLGYTRQLATDLSVSADGLYNHGLRDYKVYDLNYPTNYPVSSVRPDTQIGQNNQHASTGVSEYKAFYIKLEKRFSHRYMYTASYALSSGGDNNPHSAPVNYSSPQNDFGPAVIDRRNALVLSGSVMLPGKIMLGGIYSFRSNEPFSVTTTTTTPTILTASMLNANGTAQYIPGTKRDQGNRGISFAAINAYRTDYNVAHPTAGLSTNLTPGSISSTKYQDLDIRVSKFIFQHDSMKLEIIGQGFNVFGSENFTSINLTPTSNAFGSPTASGNVQIGELAAKFTF